MIKKILTFAIAAMVLLAAGNALASDVTKVDLSCVNGATVATINVDGTVRFTHQTEEAKDGKPFRVIVDLLSAHHKLGANHFLSLPNCPILGIRTSQFKVQPEATVRIVFDMEAEQVYRVESGDRWVKVVFADKAKRTFEPWSTAAVKPAKKTPAKPVKKAEPVKVAAQTAPAPTKSAEELNKSIDKDRMSSLEAKPEPQKTGVDKTKAKTEKKVVARKAATTQQPKGWNNETQYGPYVDATLLDEVQSAAKPKATKAAPSKKKVVAKAPSPKVEKKASEKKAAVKKAPAKTQAKPTTTTVAKKPAPAKKTKPVAKVEDKNEAQPVKKTEVKVAQAPAEKSDDGANKRSTSRFRRSPVTSKKIKGTMVAEFPKRLVIKYKSKAYRDPFATLIDESKTYDDPVERQVPNVEGLKLVGVIQAGGKNNRALFEDNESCGYILKTGDKVQKGYVLRVESDRVYFQIFEYGWSRTVALRLES